MKKEGENINFSTPTEYLVLLQAIFTGAGFVAGVLYLIFAEPKASNFIFAVYFIYVLLFIIGVVGLCKEFVDFIHRMLKVEELTKYRNDYLIAFGIMGVFFVVLRVFVYFSKFSEETFTITVFYLITSSSIYYFFVFQTFDRKCTWIHMDEKTSAKFIGTNVLVNVVLLIVGIRIAMEYNNISTRVDIIALQIFSALPSAAIFADFARVLLFGVQLINVDGERNEVTKQSVESKKVETKTIPEPEPQSKSVPSKPTCKICSAPRISVTTTPSCNMCSAPYTETGIHIPRIIKECGHSVCEQCVDNLLKLKTENFITCPFCQKVTIVNGSAETLPKNFALLEQIESVQKIPMVSVKPNIQFE